MKLFHRKEKDVTVEDVLSASGTGTTEVGTEIVKSKKENVLKRFGRGLLRRIKKHRIRTALIAALLIVTGVFGSIQYKKSQMPDISAVKTVETATVERQTLTNSISATGTVASAETKTVNTALENLEVVAVYVKEGDYVEEGDVICEFDASDYEESLATAQNNYTVNQELDNLNDPESTYEKTLSDAADSLQDAKDARDAYKIEYKNAVSDEETAKTEFEAAKAEYQAAIGNVCSALGQSETIIDAYISEVTGDSSLFDALTGEQQSAISSYQSVKSDYDSKSSAYSQAQQRTTQAENDYNNYQEAREKAQDTYDSTVEQAQDTYDKASLESQLISDSQEEKQIEDYQEKIEDCVVKATMSGVITSLEVTEGNNFEGGNIYTIQDNENFIVTASVDEYDISSLTTGMTAYVKTDATGDEEMEAELTYVAIAPVATTSTGGTATTSSSASYKIEVTLKNPDENLRAGMTGKISIALEESPDTLTVPYDAVQTDKEGNSFILVDDNGEQKQITVETGIETDYYTEIISAEVSEGMTVYLSTPITTSGTGTETQNMGGMSIMGGGGDRGGNMSGGAPGGGAPGGF